MHKNILILILAATALFSSTICAADQLRTFKINLDDPPKKRFQEPQKVYAETIIKTLDYYEANLIRYLVNAPLAVMLDYGYWYNFREYYLEMEGIAEALGVETKRVVIVNFAYELVAYCTSLLAKQTDGQLVHLRLYDFLAPELSKNMTFIAEMYKGGKLMYKAVMNGGSPFFPTGMKDGAFSITMNQRNAKNHANVEFFANMGMMSMGYKPSVMIVRETLEKCSDFKCALDNLSNDTIITGAYYILNGAQGDDASVITRDRQGAANVRSVSEQNWYVVQTNDDTYAGVCLERCGNATANFDKLGRAAFTVQSGFEQILMVEPNLNFGSIYGIKMVPKTNLFEVEIANGSYHPSDM